MSGSGKRRYGLERVPFNRAAKQLRADDNARGLEALALEQLFPRTKRKEELWHCLAEGALKAAQRWWRDGGNCYTLVDRAIQAAAREYRGRHPGAAQDVTWRGAYSTDARRYDSVAPNTVRKPGESAAAFAARERAAFSAYTESLKRLAAAMDDEAAPPLEAPDETALGSAPEEQRRADANRERDSERAKATERDGLERQAESSGALEARIATGEAVLQAVELTSHETVHADDERLNPRDDGEAAFGIEGATRGLWTGNVRPHELTEAAIEAHARLPPLMRHLLEAIRKAGSLERYIAKSADRKRRADEIRRAAVEANGELQRLTREVLAAIEAGTFPPPVASEAQPGAPRPPHVHDALPGPDVLSAAWGASTPSAARGWRFQPVRVFADEWCTVTVGGHSWGDQKRNVAAWRRRRAANPVVRWLLGQRMAGVKVRWLKPVMVQRRRSLLDV